MSSGNIWKRIFALDASLRKMVNDGVRTPEWLAEGLQALVNQSAVRKFELYLHPKQRKVGEWIGGFEFDKYLHENGLYERTLSLGDLEVKGGLENPETYPEEYRGKAVFLWKTQRGSGVRREVAYLVWHDGRVIVRWYWLVGRWDGDNPVLLASS